MIPSGTVRKYDTYKDSGIAWIGAIPERWNIVKTGRLFRNTKEIVGENSVKVERLALTLNGVIKRDKNDAEGLQPEQFDGYQYLRKNQLVFKLIDLENVNTSRVGICPFEEGMVSPAYIILKNNAKNNKFYYYFFLSLWYNEIFNHLGGDGVRSALNAKDLLNIPTVDISANEQKAIADYLDEKCGAIDKTIETEEKVIEKLKEYKQSLITETVTKGLDKSAPMKDSGIPWIGQIPQHWEVGKVVYFFGVTLGKMLQPTQKEVNETLKNYLCAANLGGNQLKIGTLKQMWFSQREKEEYTIKKNDLLVVEGGDIASCDIVPHDLPGVYFQNSILRVRPKGNMSVKILRYLLHVAKWTGHIDLICNKATIAHFTKEKLSNLACLKIPTSEQQAIVKYLDDKCAKIDKSIADKEQVIEKLMEYKKSLIYECVTGKRMVA